MTAFTPTDSAQLDTDEVVAAVARRLSTADAEIARSVAALRRLRSTATSLAEADTLAATAPLLSPSVLHQFRHDIHAVVVATADTADDMLSRWATTIATAAGHLADDNGRRNAAAAVDDLLLRPARAQADRAARALTDQADQAAAAGYVGSGPSSTVVKAMADRVVADVGHVLTRLRHTADVVDAATVDAAVGLRLLGAPAQPAERDQRLAAVAHRHPTRDDVDTVVRLVADVADTVDALARDMTAAGGLVNRRLSRGALLVLRDGIAAIDAASQGRPAHTAALPAVVTALRAVITSLPEGATTIVEALTSLVDHLSTAPFTTPPAPTVDPDDHTDPSPGSHEQQPAPSDDVPLVAAAISDATAQATETLRSAAAQIADRLIDATDHATTMRGEQLRAELDRHAGAVTEVAAGQMAQIAAHVTRQITDALRPAAGYAPGGVDLADTPPEPDPTAQVVAELSGELSTVGQHVAAASGGIETLQEVSAAQHSTISGLTTRVDALEYRMSEVLVAIGDLTATIKAVFGVSNETIATVNGGPSTLINQSPDST